MSESGNATRKRQQIAVLQPYQERIESSAQNLEHVAARLMPEAGETFFCPACSRRHFTDPARHYLHENLMRVAARIRNLLKMPDETL